MRLSSLFLATLVVGAAGTAYGQSNPFDSGSGKASAPARPASEGPLASFLDALQPRQLGPTNMGGRIMDFAVYEKRPELFYVATASGGIWKTENAGTTMSCVFDTGNSVSSGAVAISPENPDIVYVGTGEQSSRNSVAWGDGVYKSTDGGKTWKHIGLTETRHISKIVVHPTNPNIVWVAALGRLWGPNEERGLFKTTDGGKTWTKVLYLDDRTGIIDLDLDPQDPNVVYASAWERLRKPWVFYSGGYNAGIYKSKDGGKSWKRLGGGLPQAPLGRIGLSLYRKDPKIMIATVEYRLPGSDGAAVRFQSPPPGQGGAASGAAASGAARPAGATGSAQSAGGNRNNMGGVNSGQAGSPQPPRDPRFQVPSGSQFNGGGIFMSKDGGDTWTFMKQLNPRPFYFSLPLIDPNDYKTWYIGGLYLMRSKNLGKDWELVAQNSIHADMHALWVNPKNSNHILVGHDGGVSQSRDKGGAFEHLNRMPIGQFYAVTHDFQRPYWVYGGLQDNGSWGLPTQTLRGGPTFADAFSLYGGDGFYVQVDPKEPEWVYAESQGGAVGRINVRTGERRSIRPVDNEALADHRKLIDRIEKEQGKDAPKPAAPRLRFNWNTPILLSPHDPKTVFVGSNKLMMSTDRGNTWKAISPDLTTESVIKTSTSAISRRISVNEEATGAENHCTIVTISQSPIDANRIVVGTDDGMVHVTADGGKTWSDVGSKLPGRPTDVWVSRVLLSKWNKDRIYVTLDGHRTDDFKPYVYVSEDLGKTWTSLAAGLPDYDSVYVVREGAHNPDLLFLGSEMSLRFSLDRGKTWSRLRGQFPTVAVHDLSVHPEMKDLIVGTHGRSIWTIDVSLLEGLTAEKAKAPVAAFSPQPIIRLGFVAGSSWDGDQVYQSRNTQPGTFIYYHLAKEGKVGAVKIVDAKGEENIVLSGEGVPVKAGVNRVRWNGRLGGGIAPAGKYKLIIDVDGVTSEATIEVLDPTPPIGY